MNSVAPVSVSNPSFIKKLSLSKWTKFILVIAILAYLFLSGNLHLQPFDWNTHSISWLFIAVLALLVCTLLTPLRFLLLLKITRISLRWQEVFQVVYIGNFFNNFLLGTLGGDTIKYAYIARTGMSRLNVAMSILADRFIGFLSTFTVGSLAVLFYYRNIVSDNALFTVSALIVGCFFLGASTTLIGMLALSFGRAIAISVSCILALFLALADVSLFKGALYATHLSVLRGIIGEGIAGIFILNLVAAWILPGLTEGQPLWHFVKTKVFLGGKMLQLVDIFNCYRRHVPKFILAFLLSILLQSLTFISIYAIGKSLNLRPDLSLGHVFFAAPFAFTANLLPLPGGGLGAGEMAFQHVLSLCRLSNGQIILGGVSVFLFWRCLSLIFSLVGLPFYLLKRDILSSLPLNVQP